MNLAILFLFLVASTCCCVSCCFNMLLCFLLLQHDEWISITSRHRVAPEYWCINIKCTYIYINTNTYIYTHTHMRTAYAHAYIALSLVHTHVHTFPSMAWHRDRAPQNPPLCQAESFQSDGRERAHLSCTHTHTRIQSHTQTHTHTRTCSHRHTHIYIYTPHWQAESFGSHDWEKEMLVCIRTPTQTLTHIYTLHWQAKKLKCDDRERLSCIPTLAQTRTRTHTDTYVYLRIHTSLVRTHEYWEKITFSKFVTQWHLVRRHARREANTHTQTQTHTQKHRVATPLHALQCTYRQLRMHTHTHNAQTPTYTYIQTKTHRERQRQIETETKTEILWLITPADARVARWYCARELILNLRICPTLYASLSVSSWQKLVPACVCVWFVAVCCSALPCVAAFQLAEARTALNLHVCACECVFVSTRVYIHMVDTRTALYSYVRVHDVYMSLYTYIHIYT